jgi:2-oxoacid:acceptor oxidoreductase delta subunit (pyruvate/2-ketoisovalerate family)
MAFITSREKCIFATEASWSDGRGQLLCLDTGDWRTARPVVDREKCNGCAICVGFCPPQCMVDDGECFRANLAFCKGCGVCARECPKKAITMMPEGGFTDECDNT